MASFILIPFALLFGILYFFTSLVNQAYEALGLNAEQKLAIALVVILTVWLPDFCNKKNK